VIGFMIGRLRKWATQSGKALLFNRSLKFLLDLP